jgi:hypothetical protein
MYATRGEKYSSYSFLSSALDGDECSASRPGHALPPGKGTPVPIGQEAGRVPEPVWKLSGLRVGRPGVDFLKEQRFLSSPERPNRLWCRPNLLCNENTGHISGVKRPEREANHVPPFSVEVKTAQICTSASVHGISNNFFFVSHELISQLAKQR